MAHRFNGTTDTIVIPADTQFDSVSGDITISVWMKQDALVDPRKDFIWKVAHVAAAQVN